MGEKNKNFIIVLVIILALVFLSGYSMISFADGMFQGYPGLGWLFGIIAFIAAIWVIYDVFTNNKKLSEGMKVLWVVGALFFSIVTAIIYYFIAKNSKNDLFTNKKPRRNKK